MDEKSLLWYPTSGILWVNICQGLLGPEKQAVFIETDEMTERGLGCSFRRLNPSVWDGSSDSVGLQDMSEPDLQTLYLLTLL